MKTLKVLVTAVGAPGAPAIIRSLRQNGERPVKIIGVDMNSKAAGFAMADTSHLVPRGTDREYIPKILKVARDEGIDVIVPLATYELENLADNIKDFEELKIKVMVSDADKLRAVNNKGELARKLSGTGLATPDSIMVTTVEDFVKAVKKLGYPDKAVCFKPQIGSGGRGFRVLDASADSFSLLFNGKPDNTFTTLEQILPILKSRAHIPKLVIMEYLPGKEYSVDILCQNGKCYSVIPRSREQVKLGISFIGTVEKNEELIELSRKIIHETGLSYNINLQFKCDENGAPKLIEINPRLSGTVFLCVAAGVNLPYLGVKLALGEEIPRLEPRWVTRLIRYWDGIFYDNHGHAFTL
jgi:carbamoyl-phosphate synthase large subunit